MLLPESRSQKTAKNEVGFYHSPKGLLRALNDELGAAARGKREVIDPRALLVLIRRFQQLEDAITLAGEKHVHGGSPFYTEDVLRRYRAVNGFLHRYKATPTILPRFMEGDDLEKGWRFAWSREGKRSQPFMEIGFIQQIERIAAAGKIRSFKQCEQCRRWLFARFPQQRFCTSTCKEVFHRSDPRDRQRRRDWAKENYRLHKTKNVK